MEWQMSGEPVPGRLRRTSHPTEEEEIEYDLEEDDDKDEATIEVDQTRVRKADATTPEAVDEKTKPSDR
jgi:hypothetical protein